MYTSGSISFGSEVVAAPTFIFMSSAVFSPTFILYCRLIYSIISAVNSSPAILSDLSVTRPPSESTAISVVPPPISTTILPSGASMSRPIPRAAAIGSKSKNISLPPACSAESLTARISTSVLPEGIPITIRRVDRKMELRLGIIRIIPLIISSAALKSAMTPSLSGRIVFIRSCVRSCILRAVSPMATSFSVRVSIAIIEGWSTTIRPLLVITVLAVPKSMAISWVSDGKSPIFSVLFSYL